MPRITEIELVNVQSHAHLILRPTDGLNYIIGPTNAGKTSIIRAVRWCLGGGSGWRVLKRKGQGEIKVAITFDTGWRVCRIRAENVNAYEVHEPDGTIHQFDKVSHDVPDLVKQASGFGVVTLDRDSYLLNIRQQHDPLFLIADSPLMIHRKLSALVDTDVLEDAARDAQADGRSFDNAVQRTQRHISDLDEKLAALQWIDVAKAGMSEVEEALTTVKTLVAQIGVADELMSSVAVYNSRNAAYEEQKKRLGVLNTDGAEAALGTWAASLERLRLADELMGQAHSLTSRMQNIATRRTAASDQIAQAEAVITSVTVCPTCGQALPQGAHQ